MRGGGVGTGATVVAFHASAVALTLGAGNIWLASEVQMRRATNFNPEWGYVAPTPSFVRSARLVMVAAAIGATAGAAVVFSLADRPAAEQSVAARTLVRQPVVSASATVGVPVV